MYYRIAEDKNGQHTRDGVRYQLYSDVSIQVKWRHLYTWFASEADCLEAWRLTYDPQPEPEPEN